MPYQTFSGVMVAFLQARQQVSSGIRANLKPDDAALQVAIRAPPPPSHQTTHIAQPNRRIILPRDVG